MAGNRQTKYEKHSPAFSGVGASGSPIIETGGTIGSGSIVSSCEMTGAMSAEASAAFENKIAQNAVSIWDIYRKAGYGKADGRINGGIHGAK